MRAFFFFCSQLAVVLNRKIERGVCIASVMACFDWVLLCDVQRGTTEKQVTWNKTREISEWCVSSMVAVHVT